MRAGRTSGTFAVMVFGIFMVALPPAVYQLGEFKHVLTMADEKVTSSLGTGQGRYKMATGSAASLAGKTFSYTTRPNGSGQFVIDVKVE